MAREAHYYLGNVFRQNQRDSLGYEEVRAKAISKIKDLYESGVALFTKESIRDVHRQIQDENIKKISLRGLDGVNVDFDVETGAIVEDWDPKLELLVLTPIIGYQSIQVLTAPSYDIEAPLVYCSLQILHRSILRDKLTKEIWNPFPVYSSDEIGAFFQENQQRWKASESYKELRSTLASRMDSLQGVHKIVGFACGDISSEYHYSEPPRSSVQHALLLTLQEILAEGKTSDDELICYAQDPAYTDLDRSILKQSGIAVVDDPDGFLQVDSSTAVFSCAPDAPVRQIVAELAQPILMIWNKVRNDEEGERVDGFIRTDPDSPRVREMVQNHYDELEFPRDEEHFADMAIYIRRDDAKSAISQ